MSSSTDKYSPSDLRFWMVMACCGIGAVVMIWLLLNGTIEGERVAPDLHKTEGPLSR